MGQRGAQSSEKNVEWVGVEENECNVLPCSPVSLELLVLQLWVPALLQPNFRMCVTYLCGNSSAERYCKNDACIALVCYVMLYNTISVVLPLSLTFFFTTFLMSPFLRGFTGNRRQMKQRWEVCVHTLYSVKYLHAVSSLTVSSHGIASFHLKSKVSACITYFLSKNTQYERWV